MMSRLQYVLGLGLTLAIPALLVGCGGGGGTSARGTATVVLANSSVSARTVEFVSLRGETAPVPVSDIQSLTVTVTEIVLQRCEGGQDDEGADESETVLVEDASFDPTTVTIEEGGTVRWAWTTDAPHTITSGEAGGPDAGSLFDESASTAGAVVELVFADTGVYPYFSNNETDIAAGMAGTVNVVAEDDDESTDDEGEGESGDDEGHDSETEVGGHVTVFEGAFDVDLIDLTILSQYLTNAEVPAGDYCKIRVRIENPRLVLASDPNTVITDIHLTADGRIFIQDHFEIEEGEEKLIVLDFANLHLVLAGDSGQYVLTPQLQADVDVIEAETEFEGTIVAIDPDTRIIQVDTGEGNVLDVEVLDSTSISTDDDSDESDGSSAEVTLAFEDLVVGQQVEVEGLLAVDGPIQAQSIEVEDDEIDTTV
jgi:plastocyanin